jgi:hypothetical protein
MLSDGVICINQPLRARHNPHRDENPPLVTPSRSSHCKTVRHRDTANSFSTVRLRAGFARRIRSYENCRVSPGAALLFFKNRFNSQESSLLYGIGTAEKPFCVFNGLRTLPFSVCRNSFVCHSCENCRGVWVFFPKWNASVPVLPCRVASLRPPSRMNTHKNQGGGTLSNGGSLA